MNNLQNQESILRTTPTRGFKECDQEEIMKKFNILNEEYNKRAENMFVTEHENRHNFIDDNEDTQKFVESIIIKMNDEFNTMLDKMKVLTDKQNIYENYLQECNLLIKKLHECNVLYNNLNVPELTSLHSLHNKENKALISEDIITPLSLLAKKIEAKSSLVSIDVNHLRNKLSNFQKIITNTSQINSSNLLCSICYINKISHCLNPCGHTFCENCINKMSLRKCAGCRTIYTSSIKLFIQENNDTETLDISGNTSFSSIIPTPNYTELSSITSRNQISNLSYYDDAIGGTYFT